MRCGDCGLIYEDTAREDQCPHGELPATSARRSDSTTVDVIADGSPSEIS